MTQDTESDPTPDASKIPVWAFIAVTIAYLGILSALPRLLTPALYVRYGRFTSVEALWRALFLLLGALLVGCSEEAMYCGIGVTTFRVNGYSEPKVAFTALLSEDGIVYPGTGLLFAVADILIVVLLLVRRFRIEPQEPKASTPATA